MATYTPKRLTWFTLGTTDSTLYTVPTSTKTILKQVVLVNTSSTTTVNIWGVVSGNSILTGIQLQPQQIITIDLSQVMYAGDTIYCHADTANAVNIGLHGVEIV